MLVSALYVFSSFVRQVVSFACNKPMCCHLQSADDGTLTQQGFASDLDVEPQMASDAAPALTLAEEIDALLESDRTQLQDESEASHETVVTTEDDSLAAQSLAGGMPHGLSLLEGSLDTADWTAFDQQAAMSTDPDDNLSWSVMVICRVEVQGLRGLGFRPNLLTALATHMTICAVGEAETWLHQVVQQSVLQGC